MNKLHLPAIFLFISIISSFAAFSNDNKINATILSKDSLKPKFYNIDSLDNRFSKNWRFMEGDDSSMALASFDDNNWKIVNSSLEITDTTTHIFNGIGWFRWHFICDTSMTGIPLGLWIQHYGASEIFLDGILIKTFGHIQGPDSSVYINPYLSPFAFILPNSGEHIFSIRYANYNAQSNYKNFNEHIAGFILRMGELDQLQDTREFINVSSLRSMLISGFYFSLSVLHFLMFLFYRRVKSNLLFSLCMFCIALLFTSGVLSSLPDGNVTISLISEFLINPLSCIGILSLSGFINELFDKKKGIRFWTLMAFGVGVLILTLFEDTISPYGVTALVVYVSIETIIIILWAILKKVRGAWIIGTGFLLFFILTIIIIIGNLLDSNYYFGTDLIFPVLNLVILGPTISMSAYQAWKFSNVSKDLSQQLDHVQQLLLKTIEQEADISTARVKTMTAQIEKHFVFGSFSSVKNLIEESPEKAADLITRSSKFLRTTLNLSEFTTISLKQELEATENYLQIEKIHHEDKFDFKIIIEEGINTEEIIVPPLIFQPIVENSIKHGFHGIDYKGQIDINISKSGSQLICKIADNGIGFKSKPDSDHKSFGTKLTKERLELFNTLQSEKAMFRFEQMEQGVLVTLSLPLKLPLKK